MKLLIFVSILIYTYAYAETNKGQVTVLLKKPSDCEQFKKVLQGTMFTASECENASKKLRAHTAVYLGQDPLIKALRVLRERKEVLTAEEKHTFPIPDMPKVDNKH